MLLKNIEIGNIVFGYVPVKVPNGMFYSTIIKFVLSDILEEEDGKTFVFNDVNRKNNQHIIRNVKNANRERISYLFKSKHDLFEYISYMEGL